MRSIENITWKLVIGNNAAITVNPIYQSIYDTYTLDEEKYQYDGKLDCELKFINDDFLAIMFDSTGNFRSVGTTFVLQLWFGRSLRKKIPFRIADCTIDVNHRMLTFKPDIKSDYSKINDASGNEYDLNKLIPSGNRTTINLKLNPTLQVGLLNGTKIYTSSNGYYWTQEVSLTDSESQNWRYEHVCYCSIESGPYAGFYYNENDVAGYAGYAGLVLTGYNNGVANGYLITVTVYSSSHIQIAFLDPNLPNPFIGGVIILHISSYNFSYTDDRLDLYNGTTFKGTINDFSYQTVMSRVLINNSVQGAVNVEEDENNPNPYNYHYAIISYNFNMLSKYLDVTTTVNDNGYVHGSTTYYYNLNLTDSYPMESTLWSKQYGTMAMSFGYKRNWASLISIPYGDLSAQVSSSGWMRYGQALKVILEQIDPTILFEETSDYSHFLYDATNPISGVENNPIYITQKSNVIVAYHDYEAWKIPITLDNMLEFATNALNCRWYIHTDAAGAKHFRIEHIRWFYYGGSYTSSLRNTVNLTTLYDQRSGLPMSYNTFNWEYDTSNCYSRLEFEWMDTTSEYFDGLPIIIDSSHRYTEDEKKQTLSVTFFDTDLDYVLVNGEYCSKDGMMAVNVDGNNLVIHGPVTYGSTSRYVQNYRLGFWYLHQQYWKDCLAGSVANVCGVDTSVVNQAAVRKSTVTFTPQFGTEINVYSTIKTEVGYGTISSIKTNLLNGTIEVELKYQ
jgi:hypothetical protein